MEALCIFTWFYKATTSKLKTKENLSTREKREREGFQGQKSIINCNIKHELCIPITSNNNNNKNLTIHLKLATHFKVTV